MPTPHIAAQKDEIAQTVVFSGDPKRAELVAKTYLDDAKLVSDIRGICVYTGTYQGKRLTLMGHGMGTPSMGIYAHELVTEYGVKHFVRFGSCGGIQPHVKMRDLVIAQCASTDSSFVKQYGLRGDFAGPASWRLLSIMAEEVQKVGATTHIGNVWTSEHFYHFDTDNWKPWARMGALAVEMEIAALYAVAAQHGVEAVAILTVSDSHVSREELSGEEREKTFTDMMQVALNTALRA